MCYKRKLNNNKNNENRAWWCADGVIAISLFPEVPGSIPECSRKRRLLWIRLFVHTVHLLSFLRGITSPLRAILRWAKATMNIGSGSFTRALRVNSKQMCESSLRCPWNTEISNKVATFYFGLFCYRSLYRFRRSQRADGRAILFLGITRLGLVFIFNHPSKAY